MKRRIIIRTITGILMIGIMVLIFCFSMENGEESQSTSGRIVDFIQENFLKPMGINILNEDLSFFVRKLAHFSIYTALGMSTIGFILTFEKLEQKKPYLFSILIGSTYAITDEIHQLFSSGRSGKITDVILDSCGVIVGTGIIWLIYCFFKKKRLKEKEE